MDENIGNTKMIIRGCLKESFPDKEDLMSFCYDVFGSDLCVDLTTQLKHQTIVTEIMKYCDTNDCLNRLWDGIKSQRPTKHEKYYSMWERAQKEDETKKQTANGTANQFDDGSRSPVSTKPHGEGGKQGEPHPLSLNDRTAISHWFHNKLTPEERSMVLAVALFRGINRKYITSMARRIQDSLFETA